MDDSDDGAYSRPPTIEDVARIGRALNEAQARYVLIGGFAVIVHGSGRTTKDAHRSVALVISPYSRLGAVDSTLYTTAGMLRTIELILGLPPMSQYDAAATPMYGAFKSAPDLAPFTRREARVLLDEMNAPNAWGAAASMAMNLDEPDRAPDLELNEIVWKSVRGADSPMPPPVHAGFVRALEEEEEGEEDE